MVYDEGTTRGDRYGSEEKEVMEENGGLCMWLFLTKEDDT